MGAYNIVNPANLVAGQPENVGDVYANLQAIQAILNGGLDNSNVAVTAAIAASKLAGYPTDATKFLRGDGTWTIPSVAGSYVPTWSSSGVQPAIGNGALLGRYVQVGKLVWFWMSLTVGTTTTFGTGTYSFGLPVAAETTQLGRSLGNIYASHAGIGFNMAFPIIATANTFNVQYTATWPTGAQTIYSGTVPWTWASTDIMDASGVYEAV